MQAHYHRKSIYDVWNSHRKKQPVVALSTTEAEYVVLSAATQEAVWLSRPLSDIKVPSRHLYSSKKITNKLLLWRKIQFLTIEPSTLISSSIMYETPWKMELSICYIVQPEQMTADILTKLLAHQQFEIF